MADMSKQALGMVIQTLVVAAISDIGGGGSRKASHLRE